MTYHRTGGKGGTRNSARERHIDEYAPNFNKRQGSGRIRKGRKQNNPQASAAERRQRYDAMMGDRTTPPDPHWTKGDEMDAQFASRVPRFLGGIGRSKVTGKRGKYK